VVFLHTCMCCHVTLTLYFFFVFIGFNYIYLDNSVDV
jgi:hypothetical protein